ncbi:MAG: IS3 family transposase [Clostridia bacterium]|nr:IS3 family transposase [Clostridia bacterium]
MKAELSGNDTSMVCRTIGVSRGSYYYKAKQGDSEKEKLERAVISLFDRNKRRYGRRMLKKLLSRRGINISERQIARIIAESGRLAKGGTKRKRKVQKEETVAVELNLAKDMFKERRPDYILSADISQMRYLGGNWLYASAIIDVGTREIVGYQVATHMRKEIVIESINQVIGMHRYNEETIFHSDNGGQYMAKATQELLRKKGIRTSRSRPGKPMDNQPIESFWKTLKRDIGDEIKHMAFEKARMAIVEYITEYNTERLHSSLGYITPHEARIKFTAA